MTWARNRYFVEEDLGEPRDYDSVGGSAEDSFLHTESFILVDQNRYIRGVYNGLNAAAVTQLIQDVRRLQNGLAG